MSGKAAASMLECLQQWSEAGSPVQALMEEVIFSSQPCIVSVPTHGRSCCNFLRTGCVSEFLKRILTFRAVYS